jgi:hypothetical protein
MLIGQQITLDKKLYSIGDSIKIKVSKSSKDDILKTIEFSKIKNLVYHLDTSRYERYADIEILEVSDDHIIQDNKIILSNQSQFNLSISIFSIGEFRLTDDTNDLTIIKVVPPDSLNVNSDIKDILPIYESNEINWDWIKYIFGTLLIGGLIYWLIKKRKRSPSKKIQPIIEATSKPQYDITLEKLKQLRTKKLWKVEEVKSFQTELTDILREYLSHYYVKDAFNLTSDELLKAFTKHNDEKLINNYLNELFSIADLVKFAKARPEDTIFTEAIDKAITIVTNTKPKLL